MKTLELVSLVVRSQPINSNDSTYRLARCAVKWVSDCKWAGNAGREGWACAGVVLLSEGSAMMAALLGGPPVERVQSLVWRAEWLYTF